MKLSILVPVYNEAATVRTAVTKIRSVDYPCAVEVVIVNDGSTDGTGEMLAALASESDVLLVEHSQNRGKGAAIRTAVAAASGDYLVICDADLEYNPAEIPALLAPILDGRARVVYGTRSFGANTAFSFWYVMGNKCVTMFANVLFDCWISDLETCFKVLPTALYRSLDVRAAGFGMEAELTGKLLGLGYRPFEVPISYQARSREEGKKLTYRDGIEALWILTRERLRAKATPRGGRSGASGSSGS